MSLRTLYELSLQVGFENSLDDCAFERELSEQFDTLDHVVSGVRTLGTAETDTVVDLADVTAPRLVYIEGDGDFEVRLNGASETLLAVSRPASGTSATGLKAVFFATVEATSIRVSNPSASNTVIIRYVVAGDLTT